MIDRGWLVVPLLLLLLGAAAAVIGVFEGELLASPQAGWLYVKGANGFVRRVELGTATVTYGSSVPLEARSGTAAEHLQKGTRVRVTAQPRDDGEWRARQIELLRLAPQASRSRLSRPPLTGALTSNNVRFIATPTGSERLIH